MHAGSTSFGYFAAALVATAGIALFSGVQFAALAFWRRRESGYLSYAGVCLCIAALAFGNAALDTSTRLPAATGWLRLMIAAAIVSFVPFVHFIGTYTGARRVRAMVAVTVLCGILFGAIDLAAPATLFFVGVTPAVPLTLPWGEQLFTLTGTPSPWGGLFHAYTYLLFLWALGCAARQYQRGERLPAGLLASCLFAQFAALLWGDLAVDLAGLRAPYLDAFAFLPFVLLMAASLAASRARAERALADSEQRYRALFEQVDDGFCILERVERARSGAAGFRILAANRAFAAQAGDAPVAGRTVETIFPALAPYWTEVLEGVGATGASCHFEHGDTAGGRVLEHYACRLSGGARPRVAMVVRDVTARKREDEQQRMLLEELGHRVRNTLATVQSIAMQSLRDADDPVEAYRRFEGRLLALSRAHEALTRESWAGAAIDTVVAQALAPHRDGAPGRVHISGRATPLPPASALALTMALHELGANAARFGALSVPGGMVSVDWAIEVEAQGRALTLQWVEQGGPAVMPPDRRGFGRRLLERGLAREAGNRVRLDFAPGGVTCTIRSMLNEPGHGLHAEPHAGGGRVAAGPARTV